MSRIALKVSSAHLNVTPMKKQYLLPVLLLFVLLVSACTRQNDAARYEKAYEAAMDNEDYLSATTILYLKHAYDTSDVAVKDSLLKVYYLRNSWQPALNIGQQLL
ncbi:MAG: hypothetical protein ACOCZ8_04570, partial [Bacteroidota bacterium]